MTDIQKTEEKGIDVEEVFRVINYTRLGLGSLNMLLFPAGQIADATKTDIGFLSTASTGLSVLGMVGGVVAFLKKKVDENGPLKVFGFALLAIGFGLWVLLFALTKIGSFSGVKELGQKAQKLLMPICESVYGGYLIGTMIDDPDNELTVSNVGEVIQYLPSAISYTPLTNSPYYAIVILVRVGGQITSATAGFIEALEADQARLAEAKANKSESE